MKVITVYGILDWLREQPKERYFIAGQLHWCVVNQYVADMMGLPLWQVSTGLQQTQTKDEQHTWIHSEQVKRLIMAFDQGPTLGRVLDRDAVLALAYMVLCEGRGRPVEEPVLLDLSVLLEQGWVVVGAEK